MEHRGPTDDERVLVLAPTSADAALARSILAEAGVESLVSTDPNELAIALADGAGALLFTEQVLTSRSVSSDLVAVVRRQPPWSDVPILLLAAAHEDSSMPALDLESLGNVTVLERPVRVRTLVSALRSALRARRRQYQLRDRMLAIERGERQLNDLFENGSIGLHCVDRHGTIVRVNQTELDMLGYTREEYVGQPAARFHSDSAVSDDVLARLIAGERVANQEARLHCKDGSIKHVVIDSSALWEDGEFVHSRCFTRDITPAHEAMTALHESERRLRVAQEAAHGGIFEHDFATRSTYWSPELAALYGSPPVGGDGGDLSTWFQMIHPDDRRRVGEGMRAALRDGEYVQDFRVVWPDGSIHWLHVRAGIVADGDGRPLRMLGVQLDVTESTRTEESRALLASIVESSDDAMVTKSLTGIITSWNRGAERIFGYTSEEMIGQSILRLIPSDRRSEEQEILARLCRGERIEHYETVRLTKEGRAIDVSITVSPVRAASGEIIGASKVARDVTERRAIERLLRANEMALREADRRKDEFLAMLSHELRNPLAPIRNAVSLLAEKPAPNMLDGIHDMLDRQVGQMSRLVDDLLDVSRISRGVIPIAKQPLDLAEIVEMAVETARPLVTQRGHALSVTLPEHPIGIDGDRARLVQVIGNLLTNAAKFTPPGGRISLAAQMQGDDVSIVVRDDGIGIEPEAIDRVFDLFVQENTTLARDQGGLGIGLTLVRDLVRLHGGKVDLASRGRGTGTEVHVRLPTSKRAVAAGHTRGRREDGLAHSGLRILIAEDHRDTADSLRLLLVRQGHEVRLARDGRAAVSAFREFAPSVALLDIGLPELNGYEVARAIRADESGDRALLIAISGYGRDENKRAALEAGFDHHLTKPVDVRRLAQLFPS